MIYECLIVPSEEPVSLIDIKRALLTYDKIKLVDPNDRDIIPSSSYFSTIFGIPLLGMNMGAVRPMGKKLGYDDNFEKIIENCKPAIRYGLIEVISTYNIAEIKGKITIGSVLTGGYPLNTQFVFWLYRNMAEDQNFLSQAISNDKKSLLDYMSISYDVALKGIGDEEINDIPALPMIAEPSLSESDQEYLTKIARGRIASMIKYAGFCEMKNLIPIFTNKIYGNIVSKLLNNAQSVLSDIEDDKFWVRRNRILELCHEEYLNDCILDSLSIEQVIKLRSKAWGIQAKAREALFKSVRGIALELDEQSLFKTKTLDYIKEYRKNSESLIRERETLHFKIKCDIGKGVLGGGIALIGLLSQLESPLASMGLTLAAGGMWFFDITKEYLPVLKEIKAKEKEFEKGVGFGLHNFYSRINGGGSNRLTS